VKSLPKQKLVAITAGVLAVAILAGGYLLLLGPKRSQAADLARQISSTQGKIAVAEAAAHGPAATAERVKVADMFRLNRAMPETTDVAGLLLDLGRAATAAGVSLQNVTQDAAPVPASGYETVGLNVDFQGRYGQLTKLLGSLRGLVAVHNSTLEANGRLFSVEGVSFLAGAAGLPQVVASVRLEAYVFAPAAAAPAVSTTTTPAPSSSTSSAAAAGGAG
jgi:Tfp pilus assembly protein PilO